MTLEMAVAPIALAMANHPDLEKFDLSSLRYIMWGATPVSEAVARRVSERTGVRWLPAYGASEVPVIAVNPVDRPSEWRLDSAGLPPKGVSLRVADLESGAILAPGEIGEIQVLSPSAMVGYLPAEATAEAFADGWYQNGRRRLARGGRLGPSDRPLEGDDQGQRISGRSGGDRGRPPRPSLPFSTVPSSDWSTSVRAKSPSPSCSSIPTRPVSEDELKAYVAGSLATYKQLRRVVFVDAIPRLPSGKVLRRTLRDEWTPQLLNAGKEV